MTKTILKLLNFPGYLILALVGVAIQSAFFQYWPLSLLQPDFMLLFVIWAALRRSFWVGGWTTLILADFAELHSAAPQGSLLISYLVIFLGVRGFSRLAVIPNLYSLVTVTLFASMIWKLNNLALLRTLGVMNSSWRHTLIYLFPGAIIEGLFALGIYPLLDRYDTLTYHSPKRETSLTSGIEEELLLHEAESN